MLRRSLFCLLFLSFSVHAKLTVVDSRGEHSLENIPFKVATLNWDIAEQVLELGVTPIAMPDISGYRDWVVKPQVPDSVADIGMRAEPNLGKLEKLKPDLIIIGSPQADLIEKLEKIAPVLLYHTYKQAPGNVERAIENFHQIAKALGKSELAEQKIDAMYQRIAELKSQLDKHYGADRPKVAAFRFASTTTVYLYGGNSSTQEALTLLGFEPALPQPSSQWGVTQKRLKKLYEIGDGIALYFQPFNQKKKLEKSVMWNAMPFVKHNRVAAVDPSWNYGGAMSLLHIAEALAKSLIKIAPGATG